MQRLVFFDLDGTILDVDSEVVFFFFLVKNGYIGIKQFLAGCWFLLRYLFRYYHHVFVKNKAYLYGLSEEKIHALAKEYVQTEVVKKIRPKIKKIIDQHLQNGDHVVLITGTHDFLGKAIGEILGIKEVYGTQAVTENGTFTTKPPVCHPFAKTKLEIALKVCKTIDYNIKSAIAYGNSANDFYILSAVGEPVAVTPDRRLKKIARKNQWKIIG